MKSPTILTLSALLALTACAPTPADNAPKSVAAAPATQQAAAPASNSVYDLEATSIDGGKVSMADYKGKVTLIVNVASRCGYTGQYAGLQKLHAEMADKGFAVLGFPSNEFGGQEPGSEADIKQFCSSKFGVDFPMFSKVETKAGSGQSPVYAALTQPPATSRPGTSASISSARTGRRSRSTSLGLGPARQSCARRSKPRSNSAHGQRRRL